MLPIRGGPSSRGPYVRQLPPPGSPPPFKGDTRLTENPMRARQGGMFEVGANLLLTTLAVTGTLLLRPPHDWPNPARPRPAAQLEQPPNLVLAGIPQHGALRAPYFVQYCQKARQQPDIYPNLLLTTLRQPLANNGDWPNPQVRRLIAQALEPPNLLLTTLAQTTALPFAQTDWPNPPARKLAAQAELFPNLVLAGIPVYPAFPQIDWPNPQRARSTQPDQVAAPLVLGFRPFGPYEWVNPPRARVAVADQPTNLLLTTLAQTTALPFLPLDWPNPQRAKLALQVVEYPNLVLKGIPVYPAFPSFDWVNPARAAQRPQEIAPNLLLTTLSVSAALPFAPVEWINPPRAKVAPQLEQSPNLVLRGIPVYPAFKQPEWTNPARPRQAQVEVAPNLLLTTLQVTVLPFKPLDWPNPLRRTIAQPEQVSAPLVLAFRPFRPIEWQNTLRVPLRQAADYPNLLMTTLAGPPALYVIDPRYITQRGFARAFYVWPTSLYVINRSPLRPFTAGRGVRNLTVLRFSSRNFTRTTVSNRRFDTKDPTEKVTLTFDFTNDLPSGVTLSGSPTVAVTLTRGVDPSPTNILNGAASLDGTSKMVIVPVQGGVDGCEYDVSVQCNTTNALLKFELDAVLPVRS